MISWYYFWVASFAVAGSAFAFIAVVVTVRGFADLKQMFAALRAERRDR